MSSSVRILVVGVLGPFQAVLTRWFSESGHEARFATDPPAAHGVLSDWTPDLVVVDHLQTPPNFEAWWSELRSHPALGTIPIIVTGNIGAEMIQREAAAIVRRPYTRAELEFALTRVIGESEGGASG